MNLTGGSTFPNVGRRINWQLVSLTAGLAVAISAAVILGAFDHQGSRGAAISQAPAPVNPVQAPQTLTAPSAPEMTYILVRSQQEADLLQGAFSAEAAQIPGLAEQQAFLRHRRHPDP